MQAKIAFLPSYQGDLVKGQLMDKKRVFFRAT